MSSTGTTLIVTNSTGEKARQPHREMPFASGLKAYMNRSLVFVHVCVAMSDDGLGEDLSSSFVAYVSLLMRL
jgi:hypothetical protein